MDRLTEKQKKVLGFIKLKVSERMPPTIREIARELGFYSTGTVRDYLQALEKKGYLKRSSKCSRGLSLLKEGFLGIPILGRIPAGSPGLAYEEIEGYINPDDLFLGRLSQEDVFALIVKGQSMINAGIRDGDIAVIKKQPHAENGDIVAALLDDNEVTLKRLHKKGVAIFLEPANPAYQPIHKNFSLLGKLITIIRKY